MQTALSPRPRRGVTSLVPCGTPVSTFRLYGGPSCVKDGLANFVVNPTPPDSAQAPRERRRLVARALSVAQLDTLCPADDLPSAIITHLLVPYLGTLFKSVCCYSVEIAKIVKRTDPY